MPRKLPTPFLCGVLTPHGQVAPAAQRYEIVNSRCPSLRFRDTVSHLEIEHRHEILTPGRRTLSLIGFAPMLEPDLFSQGLRDLCLRILGGHL
jgi:hypothetical protein